MNINQLLLELTEIDKIIISDNHRSMTGRVFVEQVHKLSEQLDEMGIKDKRICLLRMTNNIDAVLTLFAAMANQAVVFVANHHDPIGKICDTLDKFSVFALLTDRATSVTVQKKVSEKTPFQSHTINGTELLASIISSNDNPITDIDPRMGDADIAIFSSGSTGEPKAILHKIETLLLNAQLHIQAIELAENDKIGITLPLYYSYGLVANLFSGLIAKSEIFLNAQIGSIDATWIKQNDISVLSITPFIARKLNQHYPCLKKITIGGDVLYSKEAEKLINLYPDSSVYSTYGLTEAGPRVCTHKIKSAMLHRSFIVPLGQPLNGVTISIENNATHGELVVNTPTHMIGYFSGKETVFIAQQNTVIRTGDLYEKRQSDFYFIGREKKIIFQGGEKIFPLMVESIIQDIDGVADVVVLSSQDSEKGEIARAFIVASNGVTLQDVRKKLKQKLSRSLIPDQLEFVDNIPRSLTGKMQV